MSLPTSTWQTHVYTQGEDQDKITENKHLVVNLASVYIGGFI